MREWEAYEDRECVGCHQWSPVDEQGQCAECFDEHPTVAMQNLGANLAQIGLMHEIMSREIMACALNTDLTFEGSVRFAVAVFMRQLGVFFNDRW